MPITVPDQTIAAQVPEAPSAMTQIGQLLDLQNKRQQITSGKIKNTSDQANLDEEQGVRALMQNFDSYKGADGNVDMNKFVPDVLQAAPTKGAAIISGVVNAQRDGTAAKSALAQLSQTQKAQLAQEVGSYANNGASPEDNEKRFNAFADTMPNAKPVADYFHKYVMPQAGTDPETANDAYLRAATSVMSPTEQVGANTQNGLMVTNGQQSYGVNTGPLAPGGPGAIIRGTAQQAIPGVTTEQTDPVTGKKSTVGILPPAPMPGLAPATATREAMKIPPAEQQGRDGETVRLLKEELANETNPTNRDALQRSILAKQMGLSKNQQQAQAQAPANPSYSFSTSLPAGTEKSILGTQDVVNNDHALSATRAAEAAKNIGILNNIKQYAPNAITGYAGETRQMIAGLQSFIASKLSMNTDDFAKIKTDELQKNTKMLALAGGDTNLAKNLAEVANPNTKMDTPAIISTANQLIARNKLDMAEFNFKDQFKGAAAGHPEIYTQAMKAFNDVNDHRLMQFGSMTDKEKSDLKGSMSTQDQADFGKKLTKGRQLGIIPKAGNQ